MQCQVADFIEDALLSAQPNESLGLWAKRIASTSGVSACVPRRIRMRPPFTTRRPRCINIEMHQYAAELFDEYDEPGKADRERGLADREAQKAEADRYEAAAELED